MLCKQLTTEAPIYFAANNVQRCDRTPNCPRRVGLDISTRIGIGSARGCGEFDDPEVEFGTCMTRVTTVTTEFWEIHSPSPENDVSLGTVTSTTTESMDSAAPILTGETLCGDPTIDVVTEGVEPELYDYTTTVGVPEVTYSDCWTEADVCPAATGDITYGDWSEWVPFGGETEEGRWYIDVDSGGAQISLIAAMATRGYALETKIRVSGAFPIAIAWYSIENDGTVSETTREVLTPGTERTFEAPNAANCAYSEGFGETEIVIACACAVALMDEGAE